MTCEEFRQLIRKRPTDCTRAERSAVFNHGSKCEQCMNSVFLSLMASNSTEKEVSEACNRGLKLVELDEQDPEY